MGCGRDMVNAVKVVELNLLCKGCLSYRVSGVGRWSVVLWYEVGSVAFIDCTGRFLAAAARKKIHLHVCLSNGHF